jgi:tRNA(Ile)-lysidine synthase
LSSRSRASAAPVSASEAAALFAEYKTLPVLVVAVSGGPDSTALLWLLARWRARLKTGPSLVAVTVDHGLRKGSAAEARAVAKLAAALGIAHRTLRWRGEKPRTGLAAAARDARYRLLRDAALKAAARVIVTAHTQDDQAETLLMRMARGSGIAGLSAMSRVSWRNDVIVARPLLDVPKARLVATLAQARITFATDPTNADAAFTRPRLRALMPALAEEGCDARTLARLAARTARANAALDAVVRAAAQTLMAEQTDGALALARHGFATAPEEIRLRLLMTLIARLGHEGPVELGKAEVLLGDLDAALAASPPIPWRRTLAGAVVTLKPGHVLIARAPARRAAKSSGPGRNRP